MKSEENTGKALVVSILSLSLLTVMAGAAVAPALGVIREYFADSSPELDRMRDQQRLLRGQVNLPQGWCASGLPAQPYANSSSP